MKGVSKAPEVVQHSLHNSKNNLTDLLISFMYLTIFFAFSLIIIIFFIYSFFTKSGQLKTVKMITGANNVTELGSLTPTSFHTKLWKANQDIKIYKCSNSNEFYFILESTHRNWGGSNRNYIKLTPELILELSNLTGTNNLSKSNNKTNYLK